MARVLANTGLFAALASLVLVPGALRRHLLRRRGHCIHCGYDLRHGTGGPCPECGHERA